MLFEYGENLRHAVALEDGLQGANQPELAYQYLIIAEQGFDSDHFTFELAVCAILELFDERLAAVLAELLASLLA